MATWTYIAKMKGYRTSPEFSLDFDNAGAISKISWTETILANTSILIETNVSYNGGLTWQGWKSAINGGTVQDITPSSNLSNAKFKYRVTEESFVSTSTPTLSDVTFNFQPVIDFVNEGDMTIRPEIWITKVGNGDFSIINTSNGNDEFKFTGLLDGETVYVNGEREDIQTTLALTYRINDFNDNYLDIVRGNNILKIVGNAKVQFRFQFKTKQG